MEYVKPELPYTVGVEKCVFCRCLAQVENRICRCLAQMENRICVTKVQKSILMIWVSVEWHPRFCHDSKVIVGDNRINR